MRNETQSSPVIGRLPPHSLEAEKYLLACCFMDGRQTYEKAAKRIKSGAFFEPKNRLVFEQMGESISTHGTLAIEHLAEDMKQAGLLEEIGGPSYLMDVSGQVSTTAQADSFIEQVHEFWMRRESIRVASSVVEQCYAGGDNRSPITESIEALQRLSRPPRITAIRGFSEFSVPARDDTSVLLGDRYLNRGDGAVLVSSSGMGKSSLTLQAAVLWSLGWPVFGIKPNGSLRSLVVQAEDSDGDVGEVKESIYHALELSENDRGLINDRVKVVTDRIHRGVDFISNLRQLIITHKPDLVWINPLLAFMDGDVNDARDAGKFLREGLNGLNEPANFGYFVVHHTSKPPNAKDRGERRWNEVMYDMAGSADLTNWARAIISLRAAEDEGHFNLVLAKRGRRAGAVKEVAQGVGRRLEPASSIPIKHASGFYSPPGDDRKFPLIFWEYRDEAEKPSKPNVGQGAPKKHTLHDYIDIFPIGKSAGLGVNELHRRCAAHKKIGRSQFYSILADGVELGRLLRSEDTPGKPTYFRHEV